jgi:DNA anti-recombination protein RmuC
MEKADEKHKTVQELEKEVKDLETSVATANRLNARIKVLEAEAKLGKIKFTPLKTALKDTYQRKERQLRQELEEERKKIPKEIQDAMEKARRDNAKNFDAPSYEVKG